MCPLWPLHLIIIYLLALCPLWVLCQSAPNLIASFLAEGKEMHMDAISYVYVNVTGSGLQPNDMLNVKTEDSYIATAKWNSTLGDAEYAKEDSFQGTIAINGHFIGRTTLTVEGYRDNVPIPIKNSTYPVVIQRPLRLIDRIFNSSIGIFLALVYINFGCAMHWPTVKDVVRRPVGPIIGLLGQFVFMPLMTFFLGYVIFPDRADMRLGIFVTGVAPAGGASNIWTFLLGGNLNLSLTMTTISTIAAFGLMPAWLFTLGQVSFKEAKIVVPYAHIGYIVLALVIPLLIGLALQKWAPRVTAFMVRILKVFSSCILLFIIVFAIVTNLYIFKLFTWQIIVAGMGIPWLGYVGGYAAARLFRQVHEDSLAISIETGIQNTGIAIFLLRNSLPQPLGDLTTVVPVSAAVMTPIPMMCIFFYQKIKACIKSKQLHEKIVEDLSPVSESARPADAPADGRQ